MKNSSRKKQAEHRELVKDKQQRLFGLKSLLASYEEGEHRTAYADYIRMLKRKIHSLKTQLVAMGKEVGATTNGRE